MLLLLLVWPLLARLDFYGSQLGRRLAYPFFQGSSEGLILSEVSLIRQGGSIYVPFNANLFISAPYPPVYYYLTAWVSGLVGASDTNFTVGRVISLAAAWVSGLLIAWQVFFFRPASQGSKTAILSRSHLALKGGIALVAGFAFVTLPAVMVWAARVRADMLMTAFQLAGLALVGEGVRRQKFWLVVAAVVPFTLALYTKQTALAGPAAAFFYLGFVYGRQWRKTVLWLVALVGVAGLPLLLLNFSTGGELFRRLFKYHNLPWLRVNFEEYAGLFLGENLGLLVISFALLLVAIIAIGLKLRAKQGEARDANGWLDRVIEAGRQIPLALWYLGGSLALLVGLGVAGADHNHFLPAEAATAMAAGVGLAWLLYAGRWRWLSLVGLAVLGLQLAVWSVPATRYEIELRTRDDDYQRQLGKIVTYAASKPGPILTNEAGFFVLAGKTPQDGPYYNDLFTLSALDKQGLYSEAGLLDAIRQKKFSVVLADSELFSGTGRPDVWTPELVAALRENYSLKFTDVWYTYEAKP